MIDKLAWIYIEDKRILSTRSRGKDVWYIPGGKREEGETDQAALLREIREELNVDLLGESVRFIGRFEAQAHGQAEGVTVQMTCYTADYHGELQPSAEIEELAWFSHADKAYSAPVDKIIMDWLYDHDFID
jgi:8-oxo-dGTP pyrophosphatase MutT (NUDIX family)